MYIKKITIKNFKCFEGAFSLELNEELNILVGDNESGKSTILEAINLALSGWISGKYLSTELTQSLFNSKTIKKYLESLKTSSLLPPPKILIELFFEIEEGNDSLKALFEGNANSTKKKECGIQFSISFSESYKDGYDALLASEECIDSLPIEFYDFSWSSFARGDVTPRTIFFKSHLIDSSNSRYQNGSDVYVSRIVRDFLEEEEKINVSLAHRKLKNLFSQENSIEKINEKLKTKEDNNQISDKQIKLSVDLSTKTAWENSLITYLDDIPFSNIGKGEQCLVKTKLALNHKKSQEASILLLEEPENHLSHAKLNKLIEYIKGNHNNKQIIISTHNSFVANKLGLESLILLNKEKTTDIINKTRINELKPDTQKFFEKLPGYDTLRLILCRKAILVEGPSDELIVQKAYLKIKSKLPIEDEVDVISVGTSFLRFLEIAEKIKKPTVVITDNDHNFCKNITQKYKPFENCATIKICADTTDEFNTLEPQIVEANKEQLNTLREVLGINKNEYKDKVSIIEYMKNNKTDCALKIFDTEQKITFPQYILDAINWEYEQK